MKELNLIEVNKDQGECLMFVRELMESAFPRQERPSWEVWDARLEDCPDFQVRLIRLEREPVGFVSFWQLENCCYVEHFATSEALRGKGYGSAVMELLLSASSKPILLEVELPEDDLSRRRIAFYQRCGLYLLDVDYSQPPYNEGDEWLPMHLMISQILDSIQTDQLIIELQHRVYRVSKDT